MFLGGLAIVFILILPGCGFIEESESTSYHIPNWTSDGEIIALKRWMKHRKTLLSASEPVGFKETVVLMGPNGENERELFEIDAGSPQVLELSPQGNYVGLINGGLFMLYNRRTGALIKRIKPTPSITHFKFSPDETKIYGSEYYASMMFYSVPALLLLESNELGGAGVWKNENEVLVYHKELGGLGSYNLLNSTMTHLFSFPVYIMSYVPSENMLYSLGAETVYKYELGAETYTESGFSWAPYEYRNFTRMHLSPDGKKIVMGAADPESEGTGIFILNTETNGGITRLR